MTKDEAHLAQEPVAWIGYDEGGHKILTRQRQIADAYPELYTIPLYPHPKRPWIGLTDDEVNAATPVIEEQVLIRVMEAKLKENNG